MLKDRTGEVWETVDGVVGALVRLERRREANHYLVLVLWSPYEGAPSRTVRWAELEGAPWETYLARLA